MLHRQLQCVNTVSVHLDATILQYLRRRLVISTLGAYYNVHGCLCAASI